MFFQHTALRRAALELPCLPAVLPSDSSLAAAKLALQRGDPVAGRPALEQALQATPQNPEVYILLAQQAILEGDHAQATQAVQTAIFLAPNSVPVLLAASRVAETQGMPEQANNILALVYQLATQPRMSDIYTSFLYRQEPLPTDFSPYLIGVAPDQETLDALRLYADNLDAHGNHEQAGEVRRWIEQKMDE